MNALGVIRITIAAALLGAACAGPAHAERALPKTHGALLDSVADGVAAQLLAGAVIPPGMPVRLMTPVPGDTLGLVTQHLVERLRAAGVPVRLDRWPAAPAWGMDPQGAARGEAAVDSSAVDLTLSVGAAGVTYVRPVRRFPIGIRGYERLASVRASATLVDLRTRDVLWAKSATGRASDLVRKRDLVYAATGSGGLNPPVPRGSGGRLLESIIVVGVVTGLVVLFYSNRT